MYLWLLGGFTGIIEWFEWKFGFHKKTSYYWMDWMGIWMDIFRLKYNFKYENWGVFCGILIEWNKIWSKRQFQYEIEVFLCKISWFDHFFQYIGQFKDINFTGYLEPKKLFKKCPPENFGDLLNWGDFTFINLLFKQNEINQNLTVYKSNFLHSIQFQSIQ